MLWQKNKASFFNSFEEHSKQILLSSQVVNALFSGMISNPEAYETVLNCEHVGDDITHTVIKDLCLANFIPPLDHEDISNMIHSLDDVLDNLKDAIEAYVEIYELKQATIFAIRFAEINMKCCEQLAMLCPMLRSPARYSEKIRAACHKIHELESEGDTVKKEALKELFRQYTGSKLDLAWDKIYHSLEMISDKVEDCANIADQIVMKYS